MIEKARKEEKSQIYAMWKEMFAHDDSGSIDFYFKNIYRSENTLVLKLDNKIVSSLQCLKHDLRIHGRTISVSYIGGVVTLPQYRKQGNMHTLMNNILNEVGHQDLITLIQAYNPDIYKGFGFEMVYFRKKALIKKEQVPKANTAGLTYQFTSDQLLSVYAQFSKRFTGFYLRTEAYFKNFVLEVQAEGGRVVACFDEKNQIQGYASLYPIQDWIELREVIYLDTKTLFKIINFALQLRPKVQFHCTQAEKIEAILTKVTFEEYGFMMARINDYDLFNRLCNCHVRNVQEAFHCSNKPLFIHEYY